MSESTLDVLVVDDHAVFAESLAEAFRRSEAFHQVVWANSGAAAIEQTTASPPALVIVDLRMPDVEGMELITALRDRDDAPKILVLSVAADARSILGAFEAGADGFLGKHESFEAVLRASQAVMQGDNPISASAFTRVLPRLLRTGVDLTEQEERVLELLAEGKSNETIAGDLDISYNTVRNHVSSVLRKLGVENRGEAVNEARRRFLIPPSE